MKNEFRRLVLFTTCRAGIVCLTVFLGAVPVNGRRFSVRDLFRQAYEKNRKAYQRYRRYDYLTACRQHKLKSGARDNQYRFYFLYFLHDLFKTDDAVDGKTAGALDIPYFFHHHRLNMRRQIIYLPFGKPLPRIRPPRDYRQHVNLAMIDRTPLIYFRDLLSPEPKYSHPVCGQFYTFGWCSEREMAFVMLLSAFDYRARIVMATNNHTRSEIRVPLTLRNGKKGLFIFVVDNTYGLFCIVRSYSQKTDAKWLKSYDDDDHYIRWYNEQAHSLKMRWRLLNLNISSTVIKRIYKQAAVWIAQKELAARPPEKP